MRDHGFVWFSIAIVVAILVVMGIAFAMAKPQATPKNLPAQQTDPHYVEVPTPKGNIPCIVYVNEYHPDNGAAISCDWSKR